MLDEYFSWNSYKEGKEFHEINVNMFTKKKSNEENSHEKQNQKIERKISLWSEQKKNSIGKQRFEVIKNISIIELFRLTPPIIVIIEKKNKERKK